MLLLEARRRSQTLFDRPFTKGKSTILKLTLKVSKGGVTDSKGLRPPSGRRRKSQDSQGIKNEMVI